MTESRKSDEEERTTLRLLSSATCRKSCAANKFDIMLMWFPTDSSSADDGEKGAKLLREKETRNKRLILTFLLSMVAIAVTLTAASVSSVDTFPRLRYRQGAGFHEPGLEARRVEADSLPPDSIYNLEVEDNQGHMVSLRQYAGNITLVVNTACKCGKTTVTFEQLIVLQAKYGKSGFSVLAFPSNDYHQELGTNDEIDHFLKTTFPDINFPIFASSSLKQNPVFKALQNQLPEDQVEHNFSKYLVDREGMAIDLYPKRQDPLTLESAIEELLEEI